MDAGVGGARTVSSPPQVSVTGAAVVAVVVVVELGGGVPVAARHSHSPNSTSRPMLLL